MASFSNASSRSCGWRPPFVPDRERPCMSFWIEQYLVVDRPAVDLADRLGIQLVDAAAAIASRADKSSSPQNAQVLGNCRLGDREAHTQLVHRMVAFKQQVQQR